MFELDAVRNTLAVMFTCGTYDFSGTWAYDVGVPAKSGVGGGICGVVNRLLEASERDYWTPDDQTLAALRRASEELEDRLEGVYEEAAA